MRPTDNQIRYFVKIADMGSLSLAADSLGITESALSKQLVALEAGIAQVLFTRTGRGVHLTAAGQMLYEAAATAYEKVDQSVSCLQHGTGNRGQSLRIATIHTLADHFVTRLFVDFIESYPSMHISVYVRGSPEVVHLVETGHADVGFVYDSAVASDRVSSGILFSERMCLIAREGSPVPPGGIDLLATPLPLVGFPPQYALSRMLKRAHVDCPVVAEVETVDLMLKLTSVQLGYCVLPDWLSTEMLGRYQLVKHDIRAPLLSRKVVSIVRDRSPQPGHIARLLEIAAALTAPKKAAPSA